MRAASLRRFAALILAMWVSVFFSVFSSAETERHWPTLFLRWMYGRLNRGRGVHAHDVDAGPVGRSFATFIASGVVFLAMAVVPLSASASTGCPAVDTAMAACASWVDANVNENPNFKASCYVTAGVLANTWNVDYKVHETSDNSDDWHVYQSGLSCPSGVDPTAPSASGCASVPAVTGDFGVKQDGNMSLCMPNVGGQTGTTGCTMNFTANGPSWQTQGTYWHTKGTLSPGGGTCTYTQGKAWTSTVAGGSTGAAVAPQPATDPTPTPPAPSKACGGKSCYDPNTDQYVAVDANGNQFAVPGDSARSATTGGACTSSGDNAMCAGTTAITPAAPPTTPINDPVSEKTGSDQYVTYTPTTGNQVVVVNTYGAGGTQGSSGQAVGDTSTSAPASASSSGSGNCTAGQLCNDAYAASPCAGDPNVSGDPLLGATAVELHRIRCAQDSNSIKASDVAGLDQTKGDQTVTADSLFKVGTSPDGSSLLNSLDSSGFLGGSRSCPGFAPVMYFGVNLMDSTGICETGGILAAFILAAAYALAAIIIYKGRAS